MIDSSASIDCFLYNTSMKLRWRNYLSCFGPQFVRGISILAHDAHYDRTKFRKAIRPLPDFFALGKKVPPHDASARQLRLAIWSAIAIAWILSIAFVAFIRLALWQIGLLIIVVSLPAPQILLGVATYILPKQAKRV